MKTKTLATALIGSLLLILPALAIAPAHATEVNGLYAAFWEGSFYGSPAPTWPACPTSSTTVPSPPGGSTSSTAPTATEIDPNIAHGTSTGFYWDESPPGSGFTVGSTTFKNTDFTVEWTGYIWLTGDTQYNFALESDDGSMLYINPTPGSSTITSADTVISNWATEPPTFAYGSFTPAKTGAYAIEVDYFETCDTQSGIDLLWQAPTGGYVIIPTTAFTPAQIGSNAPTLPPPGVPQFPVAAPLVAAVGLLALVLLKKRTLPSIGKTV